MSANSEDIEMNIYNLIQEESLLPSSRKLFILINPYEIDILKRNNKIKIKGIQMHYYDRWDTYNSYRNVINTYKDDTYKENEIYLLGVGPLYSFDLKKIPDNSNIHVIENFNSLKYISKYSDEVIINNYPGVDNEKFVNLLKSSHMTCLFYCDYNTGIIGIEGYASFYDDFEKYLDTIETFYMINTNKYSDFVKILEKSLYNNKSTIMKTIENCIKTSKIQFLDVNISKLYKTNPELIAYYRIPKNNEQNYINLYNNFDYKISKITDQIFIGSDTYKCELTHKYNVEWFPNDITHIINVSDSEIDLENLSNTTFTYEYYPISEREKDVDKTRKCLFEAVERLNALISDNKKVFIHCSLGVNRSPSVVILYLIKYQKMTLYEAYKLISKNRIIFTSTELFDILYKEALKIEKDIISPLKIRTHYAYNFCQPNAYLFGLYDTIYLEELYST